MKNLIYISLLAVLIVWLFFLANNTEAKEMDWCTLSFVDCQGKVTAYVTKYGWTGYKMASGKYPYIGAVATSDRSIPLGTKIIIDGQEYTVEDRTALWVHQRQGLTIDIYSEDSVKEMLNWGKRKLDILIIK